MRILHFYPSNDALISLHVNMLCEATGQDVECHTASSDMDARTLLNGTRYDILHLHGCWRNSSRKVVAAALKCGTRLVVTPHGQLEPWIMEEKRWKEKFLKRLLFQQRIIHQAYALILQGKMEQECMQRLGWNSRMVIVRNAAITHTITRKEMARQTFAVYRRVMDSNTLELMEPQTRQALRNLIIAGTWGDKRWLQMPVAKGNTADESSDNPNKSATVPSGYEGWRQLFCLSQQEQIDDTLKRGIRILGLDAPDIDFGDNYCFLPDGFNQAPSLQQALGNQFASENERLVASFRYLRKLISNRQISLRHVVEMTRELCTHHAEEDTLKETLREKRLLKTASRLMQIADELTGLPEGFMPVPPLSDRSTRKLRKQIESHLSISSTTRINLL